MYYQSDYTGRTVAYVKYYLMLGGPAHLSVHKEERSVDFIRYVDPTSINNIYGLDSIDDISDIPLETHTYNIIKIRMPHSYFYFSGLIPVDISYMPDEFEVNIAIYNNISGTIYPNNETASLIEHFQDEITRRIFYDSHYRVFYFDAIFNGSRNDAFDNPRDVINDFVRNKSKEVYRKRKKIIIKLDDNLFIL